LNEPRNQFFEKFKAPEVPLIIQEGAMLNPKKGMRLDEETAFKYVVQITEAIERVGGILSLLWHPNAIIKQSEWNIYLRTLEYLKQKNAWFGGVRDVAERWCVMSQEKAEARENLS